jgi:hypothetical protein
VIAHCGFDLPFSDSISQESVTFLCVFYLLKIYAITNHWLWNNWFISYVITHVANLDCYYCSRQLYTVDTRKHAVDIGTLN